MSLNRLEVARPIIEECLGILANLSITTGLDDELRFEAMLCHSWVGQISSNQTLRGSLVSRFVRLQGFGAHRNRSSHRRTLVPRG